MNSEEMTTGGMKMTSEERKNLALSSHAYNRQNKVYRKVFCSDLPPLTNEEILHGISKEESSNTVIEDALFEAADTKIKGI